jgi:hypothetical protein
MPQDHTWKVQRDGPGQLDGQVGVAELPLDDLFLTADEPAILRARAEDFSTRQPAEELRE